jgi:hypothetical protein
MAMLPVSIVAEVKRLLAEGKLSQRKIARQTGVSRGIVGLIAKGKRPDYQPRQVEEDLWANSGPPERCPTCGAKVYMPCRLCGLRQRLAEKQTPRVVWPGGSPIVLGLQLNDEHRARYEEIRRRPADESQDRRGEVLR